MTAPAERIQSSGHIQRAALWLATTPFEQRPAHLIPHLQQTYGLTAREAVQAIREANKMKASAS